MTGAGVGLGAGESSNVVLIGEAGNRIVWLRLERGTDQASFRMHAKDRQGISPAARGGACRLGQMFDERGDEDRLAGARKSGDAEPNMRTGGQGGEALRRGAGFEKEVGN